MDETDPFGRDKGEDPLAEMGWSGSNTASPPPDMPAPEIAQPEAPDRAARRPPPPSRYRPMGKTPISGGLPGQGSLGKLGCGFALVVLFMLGGLGFLVIPAIIDAVDEVSETIDEATPTIPDIEDGPGGGGGGGGGRERGRDAKPPSGLSEASMLRRGNLAPALKRLQRITKSSRVRLIRIDAQNVIVQTAIGGGRTRLAQANWRGEASVLSTSPGGGTGAFPWSRIDPSAPSRVVRAATRGRKTSSFDYLVLLDAAGLRWSAFLKGGQGTFQAAPDGRGVSKIG